MPEESGQPLLTLGRKLSALVNYGDNDPNELIKNRFLCRGGVMALIGQTGTGKSSLTMQMMIQFAIGKPAFCFIPKMPLKSLLLQAENDDGDTAEMRDGVLAGYKLNESENQQACENIILASSEIPSGEMFFSFLEEYLKAHKPDLVWIDPVLAFLGGDTSQQKDVSTFLRNRLQPLLKKYNCGCVIIHHTNKVITSVDAYAGSGSAEYGNMSRAVLLLMSKGKGRFELKAVKRGRRLHLKMSNGVTYTDSIFIKHSSVEGMIYWEPADADNDVLGESDRQQDLEEMILQRMPQEDMIHQDELVKKVNDETGKGINPIKHAISKMLVNKLIYAIKQPRQYARPKIYYSRKPNEKMEKAKQILAEIESKGRGGIS